MILRGLVTFTLMAGCGLGSSPRWQPDAGPGMCGDAVLDATEVCDDGNTASGDGCNAECTSDESCGNGRSDVNERCDDGNTIGGDDCSSDCQSDESCGNGVVDLARGESCDDGNSVSSDGCANNCQSNESCGNMTVDMQTGEKCDPGNNIATASCDPDCSLPNCGDGYRNSAAGEACDDGVNDIHGACPACRAPYSSCRAILAAFPSATSGVYTLAGPTGQYRAFCEMAAAGGGWTLAVKADGSRPTFAYDQAIWETSTLLSPGTPAFDRTEAKLETWNAVPFSELRVGLEYPIGSGNVTWIIVPLGANRLGDLFAAGAQRASTVGRAAWKSLIPGASLQPNCNTEGTNLYHAYSRVRLGILGNNEADCLTPDSRVGIGGGGTICSTPTQSAGNSSCYGGDNGDVELAAFGWIMVR